MEQHVDSDGPRVVAATAHEVGDARGPGRLRHRMAVAVVLGFLALAVVYLGLVVRDTAELRVFRREHCVFVRLKDIMSAQAQFCADGAAGRNGAQSTRYGFLSEIRDKMSGRSRPSHIESCPCTSCVLGMEFAQVEGGRIFDDGYIYEIYLPAKDGGWASELDVAKGRELDLQKSQKQFLCYAWPESAGRKGLRIFATDRVGDIHCSRDVHGRYSGDQAPIAGVTGCLEEAADSILAHGVNDAFGAYWVILG